MTKTFDYEAVDASGKRTKGKIEATTDGVAAATLRQQGVVPLSLIESGKGLRKDLQLPGIGGRVKLKDIAIVVRQFATMTASGLSLLRSLAILEEQTGKPALAAALREVRRGVESGLSLSGALATYMFTRAVVLLGAARAAVFPALVPPFTLVTGYVLLGNIPSLLQTIGLVMVLVGFRFTQKS